MLLALLLTVAGWRADIDQAEKQIAATHPNPYRRVSRETLHASFDALRRDLPNLTDDEAAVRLMQSVALIRDGHTGVFPGPQSTFDRWFPARFYEFTDGLFITAGANLTGAQVIRIGSVDAAERCGGRRARLRRITNSARRKPRSCCRMSISIADCTSSTATIRCRSSFACATERLRKLIFLLCERSRVSNGDSSVRCSARLASSCPRKTEWIPTPTLTFRCIFGGAARTGSRIWKSGARSTCRSTRWRTRAVTHPKPLPDSSIAYSHSPTATRSTSSSSIFATTAAAGGLINSVVHEIIKRDRTIGRPGHLFTLVGRKTFSAGLGLVIALRDHTSTMFIGEPAGAALNAFGDPDVVTLKNSKFVLSISTNYFVGSRFTDQSWTMPVHLPAQFSSADYFGDRDPAVDAILSDNAAMILDVLETAGGDAARALYDKRKGAFKNLPWWEPFRQGAMNAMGFRLLEAKRTPDALAAFEMNVDRFSDSWEAWDSLAEGLMSARKYREAIGAYRKALAISPDNWNAAEERKAIAKMERETQ